MQADQVIVVTVIVPVYNSEKYLEAALDSIIGQSLKNIEIILIDDGSTDNSGDICDSYARKDNRIKVIHQANAGISRARNRGLEEARGQYVMFADNDDICLEGWLEKNYTCIEKHHADIVKFGRVSRTIEDDTFILSEDIRDLEAGIYDRKKLQTSYFFLRDKGVFSPIWDGMYSRDFIERYHLRFDESLKNGEEDTVFCMKFLMHLNKMAINSGVYYMHYIRKGFSTSSKFNIGTLDKYVYSAKVEEEMLKYIQPIYEVGDREMSCIKNYLLPILLQLNHENCNWDKKDKIKYLRDLYSTPLFKFKAQVRSFFSTVKKDKNKAIIGILFQCHLLSVLLICSKYYYKMLAKRQLSNKLNN